MTHISEQELLQKIAKAEELIDLGAKYCHYKSPEKYYTIIAVALNEATQEPAVVYKAEYGQGITWVRTLANFFEEVTKEDGTKVKRFTRAG